MPQRYREFRFFSLVLGCEAARLSMVDIHNGEFFIIVPVEDGRAYRERREKALDAISAAIEMGCEPGEVGI